MMSPDKKPAHHHLPIIFSIDSAAMPTALSFRFLGLALCLGILLPITLPGQAPADPPSMMGGKGKGKGKGKGRATTPPETPSSPTASTPIPSITSPQPPTATPEGIALYEQKIRPVLQEKCYNCHQVGRKMKGGLAVDSLQALLTGGDSGTALVPGDAENSLLHLSISYADSDYAMPPKEQLPASVVADFKKWIDMGAPFPNTSAAPATATPTGPTADADFQIVTLSDIRGSSISYTVASEGGMMSRGGGRFSRGSEEATTHRVAETAIITSAAIARRTQDVLVGIELGGGLQNAAFNRVKDGTLRARIRLRGDEIVELNLITTEDDNDAPIAVKPKRPPSKSAFIR